MTPLGHGEKNRDDPPGIYPVDAVYGACLLARTDVVRRIGGLDEEFRFYSEDIEWCLRAARFGYRVGCVPSAIVWHKGEASTRLIGSTRRYQSGRGRALLLKRYSTTAFRVLYVLTLLPREAGGIVRADHSLGSLLSFMKGFLVVFLRPGSSRDAASVSFGHRKGMPLRDDSERRDL